MDLTQKPGSLQRSESASSDSIRDKQSNEGSHLPGPENGTRRPGVFSRVSWKKLALFLAVALVWLVLDVLSKSYAAMFDRGEVFAGPFAGLFQFKLVYNTGAAWSMFSGSPLILGVIAAIVLVVLIGLVAWFSRKISFVESFALGLVLAGGIGNALDRFTLGYVIDFIQTLFISFPIFNVADIGVTCGVVLFLISFLYRAFKSEDPLDEKGN